MAKKVKKFELTKWMRILIWIFGVFLGLILALTVGVKIWVSTWPEYKGDGFSFRYPKGWYIDDFNYDEQATYLFQVSVPPIIRDNGTVDSSNQVIITEIRVYDIKNITDASLLSPQSFTSPHVLIKPNKDSSLSISNKLDTNYHIKDEGRIYRLSTDAVPFKLLKMDIIEKILLYANNIFMVLSFKSF